jgi:16S rRNA (cytosine1402-N4)-methyltransferase
LEALNINPNGRYVDVTYGGGGHANAILDQLEEGTLIAFDRDKDARDNLIKHPNFIFIDHNYKYIKNYLKYYDFIPVDGILADLGISSHQIDEVERGFSFRGEADLDMRMDQQTELTAADIVNTADEAELVRIFSTYGELPGSKKLARLITSRRQNRALKTVSDLVAVAETMTSPKKRNRYLAQLFQALRIVVNKELEALEQLLMSSIDVMAPGGRLVVMSYHSLEDRMVKNFLNTGNIDGIPDKDDFGVLHRPFKPLYKKVIMASDEEVSENPRSRSAKLRVGERL